MFYDRAARVIVAGRDDRAGAFDDAGARRDQPGRNTLATEFLVERRVGRIKRPGVGLRHDVDVPIPSAALGHSVRGFRCRVARQFAVGVDQPRVDRFAVELPQASIGWRFNIGADRHDYPVAHDQRAAFNHPPRRDDNAPSDERMHRRRVVGNTLSWPRHRRSRRGARQQQRCEENAAKPGGANQLSLHRGSHSVVQVHRAWKLRPFITTSRVWSIRDAKSNPPYLQLRSSSTTQPGVAQRTPGPRARKPSSNPAGVSHLGVPRHGAVADPNLRSRRLFDETSPAIVAPHVSGTMQPSPKSNVRNSRDDCT